MAEIDRKGSGKRYNCIIGVSGGVDSTYVAYVVKKLGLRPLAVHLDNGWNSDMAVSNMKKALEKLQMELYNYDSDCEEFRELQLAFLKASTPDSEIPTDHALLAALYMVAARKFDRIMNYPVKSFWDYASYKKIFRNKQLLSAYHALKRH